MYQEKLDKHIKRLKNGWKWSRRKAAMELGRIGSKVIISPLVNALYDDDLQVRENARKSLGSLTNQEAIDELCAWYIHVREEVLSKLIHKMHYQAEEPQRVRVLINLKINEIKSIPEKGAEDTIALILHEALNDPDENIRRGGLKCFKDYPCYIDSIYYISLYKEKPQLILPLESRELFPQKPSLLSLYFFLNGNFDQFEKHDKDLEFIGKAYKGAGKKLRLKIYQQIKKSGNSRYFRIIQEEVEALWSAERKEFKDNEMKVMIDYFVAQKDWGRLFKLLRYAIYPFAVRIVMLLEQSGWRPADAYDQETLRAILEQIKSAREKASEDYYPLVEGELTLENPFRFFDNPEYQNLTIGEIETMLESPDPAQNAKGIYFAHTHGIPIKKEFKGLAKKGHWLVGQALLYTGLQRNINYKKLMEVDLLKGNKILSEQNVAGVIYRIPVSGEEFLNVPHQVRQWLGRQKIDGGLKDICMAMIDISEFLLKKNIAVSHN